MSNQQSMFSPEHSSYQQQQERLYNDDPREQYAQPLYQERASGEGSYEEVSTPAPTRAPSWWPPPNWRMGPFCTPVPVPLRSASPSSMAECAAIPMPVP